MSPDFLAMLDYAVKKMHEDGSLTTMSKQWYHGFDLTSRRRAVHAGLPSGAEGPP